jgi:hypothetical protein
LWCFGTNSRRAWFETEKLAYVHGSRLREYLESRPPRLSDAVLTDLGRVLSDLKREGAEGPATAPRGQF